MHKYIKLICIFWRVEFKYVRVKFPNWPFLTITNKFAVCTFHYKQSFINFVIITYLKSPKNWKRVLTKQKTEKEFIVILLYCKSIWAWFMLN